MSGTSGGSNRAVSRSEIANKDVRELVETMVAQGWRWQPGTRGNHGKLFPADRARQAIIVYRTAGASPQRLRSLIERAGGDLSC